MAQVKGESLRERTKEKDVRLSNIVAAKGVHHLYASCCAFLDL
jgi:hypothetical protein